MPIFKKQCMTPSQRYTASREAPAPTSAPEPDPAPQQVKALRSELAGLRALFERAGHPDSAYDLLCNLIDTFDDTGCKYKCHVTGQRLWRGYLSRDNTLAVKICMATLASQPKRRASLHYKGELPGIFMQRLKNQNSCKEANALFDKL